MHALLHASCRAHRVPSFDWLAELTTRSQRTAVALLRGAEEIAGFARGITDGLGNG